MQGSRSAILLLLICISHSAYAQAQPDKAAAITNFPSRFFNKIEHRITSLDDQLTHQTTKYLERMRKREQRMYEKLCKKDSAAAKALFAGSIAQYDALGKKLLSDTGGTKLHISGEYQPYADSLQGMLKFMGSGHAAGALKQVKTLEAKMQDADHIKEFVRQRKQQISQYIQQQANLSGLLGKDFQGMNRNAYYYAQRVHEYRQILNDPDKLEKQALVLLNKLPAFQAFMLKNSQLAGLFNSPSNYGNPAALAGLQTRDQVAALIQQQVSAGGPSGAAALQANLQSAQSQLDGYKDKVTTLGGGSGDIDMPDFKPNEQKIKTFWRRLEYGTNFQTTRNNYYFPTVSDFGLSVGYKLNDRSILGIGVSYKLAWGSGIQQIALSSQGVGLRSWVEIKIKGSFSAAGGLEYNYNKPFAAYQQLHQWDDWKKSGLIGVSKTVSLKSRVFKKTKVSLLWDFLSYQQVPKTQAVLFRLGYAF
jgi:FMN phosphatase YigB (HAD superfamily)